METVAQVIEIWSLISIQNLRNSTHLSSWSFQPIFLMQERFFEFFTLTWIFSYFIYMYNAFGLLEETRQPCKSFKKFNAWSWWYRYSRYSCRPHASSGQSCKFQPKKNYVELFLRSNQEVKSTFCRLLSPTFSAWPAPSSSCTFSSMLSRHYSTWSRPASAPRY